MSFIVGIHGHQMRISTRERWTRKSPRGDTRREASNKRHETLNIMFKAMIGTYRRGFSIMNSKPSKGHSEFGK